MEFGSAVVAFKAAVGGGVVVLFNVTASPGNAFAIGSSSPLTVKGLTPGVVYTFTVAAANAFGWSSKSSPSKPMTLPSAFDKGTAVYCLRFVFFFLVSLF